MGMIDDALAAQGRLEPGTEGWWKVFGARPQDIRAGDLVASKAGDDLHEDLVLELRPYQDGDLRQYLRVRWVNHHDEEWNMGMLNPVVIYRRGTKHTLADSI